MDLAEPEWSFSLIHEISNVRETEFFIEVIEKVHRAQDTLKMDAD